MEIKTSGPVSKIYGWISVVADIALGLAFLLLPQYVESILIYGIAAVIGLFGVICVIKYITDPPAAPGFNFNLSGGLTFVMIAVCMVVFFNYLTGKDLFLIGCFFILGFLFKLQSALDSRRAAKKGWWFRLAAAAVSLTFGVLILAVPTPMTFIGIAFIVEAVIDAVATFL